MLATYVMYYSSLTSKNILYIHTMLATYVMYYSSLASNNILYTHTMYYIQIIISNLACCIHTIATYVQLSL